MENIPEDQIELIKISIAQKFLIDHKDIMLKSCVVLISICCIFGGCSYFNKKLGLKNDHFVEEKVEKIIENETGLKIDLTPDDLTDPDL